MVAHRARDHLGRRRGQDERPERRAGLHPRAADLDQAQRRLRRDRPLALRGAAPRSATARTASAAGPRRRRRSGRARRRRAGRRAGRWIDASRKSIARAGLLSGQRLGARRDETVEARELAEAPLHATCTWRSPGASCAVACASERSCMTSRPPSTAASTRRAGDDADRDERDAARRPRRGAPPRGGAGR